MPDHWSVSEVRTYLQHHSSVSDAKALHLEQQLPANWRALIYRHGRARVFNCLRLNMTIGGAQYELNSKPYLGKQPIGPRLDVTLASRWLR